MDFQDDNSTNLQYLCSVVLLASRGTLGVLRVVCAGRDNRTDPWPPFHSSLQIKFTHHPDVFSVVSGTTWNPVRWQVAEGSFFTPICRNTP